MQEMILPVAKHLGINEDRVYANSLRFHSDGAFASFDPQAWTAADGGNKRVVQHIRQLHAAGGKDALALTLVMIGDGATDLEARDDGSNSGAADL